MRKTFLGLVSAIAASLATFTSPASAERTLYLNGRMWTGIDGKFAESLLVEGDRIVRTGTGAELRKVAPESRIVDLGGRFVAPGFIDNHTHFMGGALDLARLNLRDAKTPAEFTRRVGDAARAAPGRWILGGTWDHEQWGGALPERGWIDAVTGATPVWISRLDGHMALANSAALAAAGVTAQTPDPPGGVIVRDAEGNPTGLMKDAAMELVDKVVPAATEAEKRLALEAATEHALARGVTQVHDMGSWGDLDFYRRAHADGKLRLRVYALTPLRQWKKLVQLLNANGRGDDWLRWGGVKGFVDGSLGSTTAWFHAPYADEPSTSGFMVSDAATLEENMRGADANGLQLAIHAIGDRANDWLLDVFERLPKATGSNQRRVRVEHAQHLSPQAIRRFAALGVTASMQPYHAIDDGRWAEKRIGRERLRGTYAFRSLLDAGATLSFGSDWTVAPLSPLEGIYAAVTRQTLDGRNPKGWVPAEKISIEQALRAYTVANAWAGYQEAKIGRLAPGYLADFVVLAEDPFAVAPERIRSIEVLSTVIGGREVYRSPQGKPLRKLFRSEANLDR